MAETTIEPGVYPDIPFNVYSAWPAVRYSTLKGFRKTALHARYLMTHQEESSKYQARGHAVHAAILEPERFSESFAVAPKVDRRTREGKAAWERFLKESGGKEVITNEDFEIAMSLKQTIDGHTTAREMLRGPGANELSLVWDQPLEDGEKTVVRCKGRLDRLLEYQGYPFILDVKTTSEAPTSHHVEKQIAFYGYNEQAALYLMGAQALAPLDHPRKFVWLFAETEPPFTVRLFEADTEALSMGYDEVNKHLRAYAECERTGLWPAWGEGMDMAGLPGWAYKRFGVE